jgi:glutamate racemase
VILACNTATVHAIRPLQQVRFPDRKILGVTIPGAEKVVEAGFRNIGILATEGTVRIRAYKERVHLLDDTVKVTEVAAPELVPLIEAGVTEGTEIVRILENHVSEFDGATEALVLGCTHFPLVRRELEPILEQRFRRRIAIVDPGYEAAVKFESYLERHPAVAEKISRGGTLTESYS